MRNRHAVLTGSILFLAGLATLALWVAGILLAAGGLSAVAKRLRFAPGNAVPSPQRGGAD